MGVGCLREERAGKVRDAFGSPQDVQTLLPKERKAIDFWMEIGEGC